MMEWMRLIKDDDIVHIVTKVEPRLTDVQCTLTTLCGLEVISKTFTVSGRGGWEGGKRVAYCGKCQRMLKEE